MLSPSSPEWQETKDWIEKRVEALRNQLEVVGLPAEDTNALRGRVAELRDFLSAASDPHLAEALLMPSAPVQQAMAEQPPDYT